MWVPSFQLQAAAFDESFLLFLKFWQWASLYRTENVSLQAVLTPIQYGTVNGSLQRVPKSLGHFSDSVWDSESFSPDDLCCCRSLSTRGGVDTGVVATASFLTILGKGEEQQSVSLLFHMTYVTTTAFTQADQSLFCLERSSRDVVRTPTTVFLMMGSGTDPDPATDKEFVWIFFSGVLPLCSLAVGGDCLVWNLLILLWITVRMDVNLQRL